MSTATQGIPLIVTSAGATPADPTTLNDTLIANATALQPGLTANLPGTLIEDIASTCTGALVVVDSAYIELVNSISPNNANPFLLNQLGNLYGIPQGQGSNGSVYVVFSGPAGFAINPGFTVTDGTNQYIVQDGGAILTGGVSAGLYCLAVQSGTFAIPANTVNALVTSVPTGYTITCNNPTAGTPAVAAQTLPEYQASVLQAGQSTAQGMPDFVKTQLGKVSGVVSRLVSMQVNGSSWTITEGGGDPYAVGYAIYRSVPDINILVGSTLRVTAITNANPGVVTTQIAHGYTTGAVATITGATGITGINGVPLTITVLTPYTFSIGVNTTSSGAYTGNGVLSPNLRNQTVSINSYPDSYTIPFVTPLQQLVGMTVTWNTSGSYVNPSAVSALAVPAIVDYVNSIQGGQPLNLLVLESSFVTAVASLLTAEQITELQFAITINGISASPGAGLTIIPGDAYSYFETTTPDIVVTQA